MAEHMDKLAEAFTDRDEIERFLANLEQLKSDGAITEEQYTSAREDYYQRLGTAVSRISQIKNELKKELGVVKQEREILRQELSKLDVKHRVGELSTDQYQASGKELTSKVAELEQNIGEVDLLIGANSAAELAAISREPVSVTPPPLKGAAPGEKSVPKTKRSISVPRPMLMIGGAIVLVAIVVVVVVMMLLPGEKGGTTGLPGDLFETVDIPVNIVGADGVGSLYFDLAYDWDVLRAVDVKDGPALGDAILEYDISAPGRVFVGIIDDEGISEDGMVVSVTFLINSEVETATTLGLENPIAYHATSLAAITVSGSTGTFTGKDDPVQAPALRFTTAGN